MPIIKIYLELTFKCNLKCKFCYVWDMQNEKHEYFDIKNLTDIKKNIDKIFIDWKEHTYHVDILWWESLLNPFFFEIVWYISNKNNIARFTLTSNTTLLSDSVISKIKESAINELRISIHWLEKTHNHIVGWNVFSNVINSLFLLKKYNINYTLIYVYNNLNKNELLDLLLFLNKEGISPCSIFIEFIEFSWYALNNIDELNLVYNNNLKKDVSSLLREIKKISNINPAISNFPKCMLPINYHDYIDDNYSEWHRYELYYPWLARKSLFWFSNDNQRKIIKNNLINGYKINFQKKLDIKYIPNNCNMCEFKDNCYLLTKESILYDYLWKEFLKRKHYFEINNEIVWK